jgi:hypothetical protein
MWQAGAYDGRSICVTKGSQFWFLPNSAEDRIVTKSFPAFMLTKAGAAANAFVSRRFPCAVQFLRQFGLTK